MKNRNSLSQYNLHFNTDPGSPGSGGSNAPASGQQTSAPAAPQNNSQTNEPDFANLWQTPSTGSANAPQQAPTPQQPSVQQSPAMSADEAFAAHVKGLNFGGNVDSMIAAIEKGDKAGLQSFFADLQTQTYKQAMLNVHRMMKEQGTQLKGELQADTEQSITSKTAIAMMHKALPYSAMPAYEPFAKAALTQFLKQGHNLEKAVEFTGKYLQKMASDINGGPAKPGQPGSNASNQEIPDWITLLGGKKS